MNPFDLSGKVAIVTGGASGIGLGIARGLAQAGATVVLAARDAGRGTSAADGLRAGGWRADFRPLDLRDPASCRTLIAEAAQAHGGIDILVNNAGMNILKAPEHLTLDEWNETLAVNLTGAFVMCQAVHPLLVRRTGGKIVNIGSTATLLGSATASAYAASKGGIGQLTRSLAEAWGRDNIQVNAVLPGYIGTELVEHARATRPGFDEKVISRTPAGRFGRPDDVASAVLYFASPASDYVTGALLPVDGGFTCHL